MLLNFALGKLFADLGEFDRSFGFYRPPMAARRKRAIAMALPCKRLGHVRMAFQQPLFDRLAGAGVTTFKPIFIVGMPRSGSTLIEQILASHPQVHGGDELPLTTEIIAAARKKHFRSSVPDLVRVASPWISEMARAYIRDARPLIGQKPRLVDKYLDNFWHIGLLKLMFPERRSSTASATRSTTRCRSTASPSPTPDRPSPTTSRRSAPTSRCMTA